MSPEFVDAAGMIALWVIAFTLLAMVVTRRF